MAALPLCSINLFKTGVVQETRMKTGYPLIHGLVYDLADGHLNTLNLDLLGMLVGWLGDCMLH